MRNRILSYPVLFILFMPFIAHCRQEQPPIKIGFVSQLTGISSAVGIRTRNGALMAVDDINADGGIHGRKISIIVKDDQLDPETAVKVDLELIESNVAAIIGHAESGMCQAALPLANQKKTVLMSPVAPSSRLTGIDDYLFRINPPTKETSIASAQYAYKIGLRKMVALYELTSKAYTQPKFTDFKNAFEALGGQISAMTFSSDKKVSFPDLILGLTQTHPDGYFIIAGPADTALICQHLRKIDATGPVIISPWAYDPELIRNGSTAVEGVILTHSFQRNSRQAEFLKFREAFIKQYKTTPGIWETFGYEAVMVISQALSRNPDPKQLKSTLLETGPFKGLQGDIRFDRYGDNQRKPLLLTIKNGAFIEIR